jgi:hypothetical protein
MQEQLKLLGCTVRDRITGLTGVVSSIAFEITGQVSAAVNPKYDDKEEKLPTGIWIAVQRLEWTAAKAVMPPPDTWVEITETRKRAA